MSPLSRAIPVNSVVASSSHPFPQPSSHPPNTWRHSTSVQWCSVFDLSDVTGTYTPSGASQGYPPSSFDNSFPLFLPLAERHPALTPRASADVAAFPAADGGWNPASGSGPRGSSGCRSGTSWSTWTAWSRARPLCTRTAWSACVCAWGSSSAPSGTWCTTSGGTAASWCSPGISRGTSARCGSSVCTCFGPENI